MTDPAKEFASARLKIQRADRHINDLMGVVVTFLETDFCKLHIEEDPKTAGQYLVKIDATAPFPPEIPLIIGDAVHNLRSALDHIVVQFTKGDDRMALPTGKDRNNVESAPHYRTIKKTMPDFALHILEEIQPYEGGKFKVWELGKLDNIDKHRLLIPTTNLTGLVDVDFEDERGNRFTNHSFTLSQGGVGLFIVGLGKVKINNHGKPTIDIGFASGTPFQHESVLVTLSHLSQLTLKAVEALELFCFGAISGPHHSHAHRENHL